MNEEPISYRVVSEVATATDADPADLRPLHDVIDPDALEALFDDADGTKLAEGYVSFNYEGHIVRVDGGGDVSITSAEPASDD